MRYGSLLLILAFVTTLSAIGPNASAQEGLLTPIPLDPTDPSRHTVGALEFVAGYQLSLDNEGWGGFSDLCVWRDEQAGTRLLAVSDQGIEATLGFTGTPESLGEVAIIRLYSLRTPDGRRLVDKLSGDAEAMVCDSPTRRVVGFERQHRLWVYEDDTVTALPFPTTARMLTPNEGIEGMARLPDGRLFMIAEGAQADDRSPAWIQDGDGWAELTVRRSEGFQVTGLASLPDGNLLLLERFYTPERGPAARLSVIRAVLVQADAEIRPQEIARLTPPMNVDNFEGVAVVPDGTGGSTVFLLSDDNLNPAQRTLLLIFRLAP